MRHTVKHGAALALRSARPSRCAGRDRAQPTRPPRVLIALFALWLLDLLRAANVAD